MFAMPQAASPMAFFHSKNDQCSAHPCKVHATLKSDTEVHRPVRSGKACPVTVFAISMATAVFQTRKRPLLRTRHGRHFDDFKPSNARAGDASPPLGLGKWCCAQRQWGGVSWRLRPCNQHSQRSRFCRPDARLAAYPRAARSCRRAGRGQHRSRRVENRGSGRSTQCHHRQQRAARCQQFECFCQSPRP